jgi:predicted nucleic acid-binding protein
MTALVFVDTNVLLYKYDRSQSDKKRASEEWFQYLWRTKTGRLSQQVLHEFYANATRKVRFNLDRRYAREVIEDLASWHPVPLDMRLLGRACAVEDRFGLSFWDSLIVAAAQAAKCGLLLTEDLQHGQDLDGVTVMNPFIDPPGKSRASELHEPPR